MVDEETQVDGTANSGDEGPSEEYKNLQRTLEKERRKRVEATRDALKVSVVDAKLDVMNASMRDLADAMKSGADEDEVNAILVKNQAASEAVTSQGQYSEQIQGLLGETEFDWSDDEVASAREAWEAGDLPKALREVEKIARPGAGSAEEITQLVDQGVQKALARMGIGVDEGSQSSSANKEPQVSLADVVTDPTAGKKAVSTYLDTMYKNIKPRS